MHPRLVSSFLAVLLAGPGLAHASEPMPRRHPGDARVNTSKTPRPPDSMLAALSSASTWLNSPPLGPEAFRGKVVVVSFWTFTCINWRRTAPYLRAWVDRYGPEGLVLVGVHTPEFVFEQELPNVRQALAQIGIGYPVALDSDFRIWRAFDNEAWPALYVFDAQGKLRHKQLGEDDYARADEVIRGLLAEAAHRAPEHTPTRVDAHGAELAADWASLASPENYLGVEKTRGFASPGGLAEGVSHGYAFPDTWRRNAWGLSGAWTVVGDRARSDAAPARVALRFHARDVHLVAGAADPARPIRFRVLVDGEPASRSHGVDVDAEGRGTLRERRMYHLVRQQGRIGERLVEVELLDPGAELFSVTFG